ncbi:MAG TPA: acylphosphatase [Chitinophagaceae bacterium]|jgi:acylphosphatase
MITVHLIIEGEVQGVFYRATAKEIADRLGITGWIKNTLEGNVEAMVTGDETSVQKFINWCWQGPKKAEVTNVTVTKKEEQSFNNFSVVR